MYKLYSIIILFNIILFSMSVLVFSGCGSTEKHQAIANTTQQVKQSLKDTPRQVGIKQYYATIEEFEFNKSYKEADIVAQVKILEWLEEINDPLGEMSTYFKAELEKSYKNTLDSDIKEIRLKQDGNSYHTSHVLPLFKNGDRLLLYLKKAVGEGKENTYWILGSYSGVFRIVNTEGKDFVVKQVGNCPELSSALATEHSAKVRNILFEDYKVEFSNVGTGTLEIYDLDTVEQLILAAGN
jgi:hypothetical protein